MTREKILLIKAIPYIETIKNVAETNHDNPEDPGFMDIEQYEIMIAAEELLFEIEEAVK